MRILIIRHGRTQGNIERRYVGAGTDEHLLDSEREELAEVSLCGRCLVASSPMKRALETAEIMIPGITAGSEEINGDLTGIKFLTIDELHETDFGIFEGRTYEELNADPDTRDAYQAWIDSGGTMKIPGGESLEESQARSLEGFHKAVQKARTAGADQLVIVAHGGTVMSVMQSLFGGNYYDYYTGNGDGYTFELEVDDAGDITAAGTYDRFCGRIRA
jgi:alpha-ribazole phosphatase